MSYIQATGEVYAAEQWGPCRVRVLGIVPPDPDERRWDGSPWEGKHYYRTLNQILDGWADPDITSHDLAWVEQRLAAS